MQDKRIINFLLSSGFKPNLNGFRYLYEAIDMTIKNRNVLPPVTKVVYPTIGEKFNETAGRVERCIRHTIRTSSQTKIKYMKCSEFIANAAIEVSFSMN